MDDIGMIYIRIFFRNLELVYLWNLKQIITFMNKFIYLLVIAFIVQACQPDNSNRQEEISKNDPNAIVVLEVLNTSNYTYMRAKHKDAEQWFALPLTEAKTGEKYYFNQGMEMRDFASKELGRTFESIYFIEGISTSPNSGQAETAPIEDQDHPAEETHNTTIETGAGAKVEKRKVELAPAEDGVSIAALFSKKENYAGKILKVKGKVIKYSAGIMNKNWVHLQDGTDYKGKYDLTVTSLQEVNVGDTVIFEGLISLNKDLGHGYFFEVIMEDAVLK